MNIKLEELGKDPFGVSDKKTFIFAPVEGKDMRNEYPELQTIPEFLFLNEEEMRFVWLIANRTSPFNVIGEHNQAKKGEAYRGALKHSGLGKKIGDAQSKEIGSGILPDKLHKGAKRMEIFNPSIRMRAKLMAELMFANQEKMISITEEELKVMGVGDKKDYASLCKNIADNLENLVPQLENAYGVKDVGKSKGKGESGGPTLMDIVLNEA